MKRFLLMAVGAIMLLLNFSPSADAETIATRLSGADRYLTAIEVSKDGWPSGVDTVILTTGENYPDALSAAPLAGKYNAPILLVSSKGMSPETLTEVKRLQAKKAYIVGGIGVIPVSVESQLSTNKISVTRIAGKDRYDTSMAVARSVGMSKGIFITSGHSFADALSVAPIAAAEGMPIIAVPKDDLTTSQQSYFARAKEVRTIIVGSKSEIPDKIRGRFSSAENIEGADPYTRNIALLQSFGDSLNQSTIFVATGQAYPDALSAGAYAQKEKSPVILIQGSNIPLSVERYLSMNVVSEIKVLGGEGVISASAASRLASLTPMITEVKSLSVTVQENQNYELPRIVEGKTDKGSWVQVPVDWNLDNVSTKEAGTYYYSGKVAGFTGSVELALTVESAPTTADSLTAEIILGNNYTLPERVTVSYSDKSTKEMPVKWSSNPTVSNLNKVGSYNFQGEVEGADLKTGFNLKVSEDKAVDFKNSHLEWAVRVAVGKRDSPQPIYLSDVLKLTHLEAKGQGIDDLTGLETFTNLTSLDLSSNFLEGGKLSPLQNLKNLKSLNLEFNKLEQISSLQNLTQLTYLKVNHNQIKDLSPIKNLTRLKALYIKGNETVDFSPTRTFYHQLDEKDFTI